METQKEYYYTYYSYEEWGRGYFGSRGCKCLPEEDIKYFGSSKDKNFKPTQKIILKSDYATREEAYADEIILQQYYKVVENPHFANKAYQTSTKFYVLREQASKNGKKGGLKFPKEQRIENARNGGLIGGKLTKELGIGIHGRTKEQMSEDGRKAGKIGGKKSKELGVGVHGRTKEKMSEDGVKGGTIGGKKIKELGIGIYGLTPEQRSENARKGGKIGGSKGGKKTNAQKWECTETGYVANPGNLTKYQRKRGIDTSNRKRIA